MKTTIAVAIILGIIRIWIGCTVTPGHFDWVNAFKDVAHLFIGGLFVAWRYQRSEWQFTTFCALTGLEVLVAILSRI